MSEVTRREYQRLVEQVGSLEARLRALEIQVASHEVRLRPGDLLRAIKQQDRDESAGATQKPVLPPEITGFLQPDQPPPGKPALDLDQRYPNLPPPLADL